MDDSLPAFPAQENATYELKGAELTAYARVAIAADRASRPSVPADRRALAEEAKRLVGRYAQDAASHRQGCLHYKDMYRSQDAAYAAIDALAAAPSGADARDGARYRWLRDESGGQICFDHTEGKKDGNRFEIYVPFDGREIPDDEVLAHTFDESVDAAMTPPPAMPKEQP